MALEFLSTPSARRATTRSQRPRTGLRNFYPRPLRGGRRNFEARARDCIIISIHALCEEGDESSSAALVGRGVISIHALCEEGDHQEQDHVRAAEDFYPRPLRGGRLKLLDIVDDLHKFLSTPSARRATSAVLPRQAAHGDFYPRPLRGGRRIFDGLKCTLKRFLSTPSARRATQPGQRDLSALQFLSTPSARRATFRTRWKLPHPADFYPRPLRGGRHPKGD